MKLRLSLRALSLLLCLCPALLLGAEPSLAPPPAPQVAGLPVPVTAHRGQNFLLDSAVPELAANKRLVFDFWRTVVLGGQTDTVERFMTADFVEHNPLLPNGRALFHDYMAANSAPQPVPDTIQDLVTLVAEGSYVAMALVTHYPEADGSGTYTSTHFELFRIAGGLVAEHWDSTLFRAGQSVPDYGDNKAVPVVGVAGVGQLAQVANAAPVLFANKRLVYDLWRQIPEGGREELAELYLDPIYIQHNPNAATGRAGFQEYFSRRPDTTVESYLEAPLVALIAEGDLVVQVLETERTQDGVTYKVPWFDMFRIANGRIIEHWDTASKGELPAVMQQGLPLGQ